MRGAVVVLICLLGGCFAEMTAGTYKVSGAANDRAWVLGWTSGFRFDYQRLVRGGVGLSGDMGWTRVARGRINPRTVSTVIRGDLSVVNGFERRVRITGGYELPATGDVILHYDTDMGRVVGSARRSGWFAGLSYERTHLATGVTAQVTFDVHAFELDSNIVEPSQFIGPQVRLTFTYFPIFQPKSHGFMEGLGEVFANHWQEPLPTGTACQAYSSSYRSVTGQLVTKEYTQCN